MKTTLKSPFSKEVYERNAEIYKLLANPKRLEILNLLKLQKCTVNELAKIIGVPKANISQHLTILRYLRIVSVNRVGRFAYYKIVDPKIIDHFNTLKAFK